MTDSTAPPEILPPAPAARAMGMVSTLAGLVLVTLGTQSLLLTAAAQSATGFEPGRPFELAVGRSATSRSGDLQVRFDGVLSDSRCPTGVQCIWAGAATVQLTIGAPSRGGSVVELTLPTQPTRAVPDGTHAITLLELRPYPVHGRSTPPTEVVARLSVAPAASGAAR